MVRLAALAAVALGSAEAAWGQDRPATPAELAAHAQEFVDSELAGLWPLRANVSSADVLSLSVEQGRLVATYNTALPLEPMFIRSRRGRVALYMADPSGEARLQLTLRNGLVPSFIGRPRSLPNVRVPMPDGGAARLSERRSRRSGDVALIDLLRPFAAKADELLEPGDRVTGYTAIAVGPAPGRIHATRAYDRVDGSTVTVDLMQTPLDPAGSEDFEITLRVDHSAANDLGVAAPVEPVRLQGQTLDDLRTQDPAAFNRHVRPMLAELGMIELVDESTRQLATALFLAQLPTPPEVVERVDAAVANLASPQFARRRAAEGTLRRLGRPAASELARRLADPAQDLTAEQRGRIEAVVAEWSQLPPDATRDDRDLLRAIAALQGGPDDAALRELAEAALATLAE